MTPIAARLFVPTAEALEWVWNKFDANRHLFDDSLVKTPIEMACWLGARDTVSFTVGEDEAAPDGIVIFAGVQPGYGAIAHIFLWDHAKHHPAAIIKTLRVIALTAMQLCDLHRITLLTPVRKPEAVILAKRVGFKKEGQCVEAFRENDGQWVDAIVLGLLPTYVQEAEERDTLISGGKEE